MMQGVIVLLVSLISGVVMVGGLGKLALRILGLRYEGEERLFAVFFFGISLLSFVSVILFLVGLFNPLVVKALFILALVFLMRGFKIPKLVKPDIAVVIMVILAVPSILYVVVSPVVEKDMVYMTTIQRLVNSGGYMPPQERDQGEYLFVFASAALSSVFDWIPAYNFLSGYGWVITLAMLWSVYVLSKQLFDRETAIASMILITCFQLYSRAIDFRSSIISLVYFIILVFLTVKWFGKNISLKSVGELLKQKQRLLLFTAVLLNVFFTSRFGFFVSLTFFPIFILSSELEKRKLSSGWILLAATAVLIAVALIAPMKDYGDILTRFLDYGVFALLGIGGVVLLWKDARVSSFYTTVLVLLVGAFSINIIFQDNFAYPGAVQDMVKNITIYLMPLSLCISGAYVISKISKKHAICIAVAVILIPHQAWFYESMIKLHVPSREEVHSYTPYPGGVSGAPFILPVQAAYMTFRYNDAYSQGLFPVSIYGKERTDIISYLFYKTDKTGFFSDLSPEDKSQEFDAIMKYTGIRQVKLDAEETRTVEVGSSDEKMTILSGKGIKWLIVTQEQAEKIPEIKSAEGKALKRVFTSGNYTVLEAQ